MNDRTGSIIWNLMLFGGFVYVFLIMHGIVKTTLEIKTLQKPSLFVRALVYCGILTFGILVVMDILGK